MEHGDPFEPSLLALGDLAFAGRADILALVHEAGLTSGHAELWGHADELHFDQLEPNQLAVVVALALPIHGPAVVARRLLSRQLFPLSRLVSGAFWANVGTWELDGPGDWSAVGALLTVDQSWPLARQFLPYAEHGGPRLLAALARHPATAPTVITAALAGRYDFELVAPSASACELVWDTLRRAGEPFTLNVNNYSFVRAMSSTRVLLQLIAAVRSGQVSLAASLADSLAGSLDAPPVVGIDAALHLAAGGRLERMALDTGRDVALCFAATSDPVGLFRMLSAPDRIQHSTLSVGMEHIAGPERGGQRHALLATLRPTDVYELSGIAPLSEGEMGVLAKRTDIDLDLLHPCPAVRSARFGRGITDLGYARGSTLFSAEDLIAFVDQFNADPHLLATTACLAERNPDVPLEHLAETASAILR